MEANIIYRITKGDEKALDAFIDYYSQHLYRIAFSITGNKETSEEIVSDVFFEIWQNRKDLLKIDNILIYLRKLTYNKTISRKRHDDIIEYADTPSEEIPEAYHIPVVAADEEIISREEVDEINRAIDELPPKCRHVFTLAKLERVSYEEISQLLGISVSTINFHVKTAVGFLRKRLRRFRPPD